MRDEFNRLDGWVFDLGRENNAKLAVGHFYRYRLDIGLIGTTSLDPDVEVLELMPVDVERKDALARAGNSLVGFRKVEFRDIFAVGNLLRESRHPPMLADKQIRILGAGHPRSGTTAALTETATRITTSARSASRTAGHFGLPDGIAGQLIKSHQHCTIAAGSADQLVTVNQWRFAVAPSRYCTTKIRHQVPLPNHLAVGRLKASHIARQPHDIQSVTIHGRGSTRTFF